MLIGIDHIVIAGPDLDKLTAAFEAIGFHVVAGGRHPIGSYNTLIGLQDGAYVELLSFYEESPGHYWWDAVHVRGGGLIDFCMQTDDIQSDYAAFAVQGLEMSGLVGLSRERFDGYHLAWVNNEVYGQYQGLIPFIIADKTPREERVPQQHQHDNRVTGIDTLTLAASDLERAQAIMSAALGKAGTPVVDEALKAVGIVFEVGTHRLEYLQPKDDSSPLHRHILQNAPVPWRIRFKTTGQKKSFAPQNTAGVRIEFV